MINHQKIIFSDEKILEKKMKTFKNSYKNHRNEENGKKDTILVVTDFDYTLFNKYNYITGVKYDSSYGMYNQDVFGGDQKNFENKNKIIDDIYLKYDEDFTINEKIRKEKMKE